MKKSKITFILTLIGILLLTFLSQSKPIYTATIESIQTSQFKTIIKLQNKTTELIIFDKSDLNLKPKDTIEFQGKQGEYKNQKQIIASKITLSQNQNKTH